MPESFKVLERAQSLALDVKILDDEGKEIEIKVSMRISEPLDLDLVTG